MQTLSQSATVKALLSKAFIVALLKFACLTRTDVTYPFFSESLPYRDKPVISFSVPSLVAVCF